jgi:transposase-like protein
VYDGVFEVLQWLLFLSAVPPVQLLTVVRNGKSTAGHQRYLCSHCRKTWQLRFTYTASQPGTHQKIIDMAMNGVGCRATARIMGVGLNTILRHLKNSGRSR